MNNRFKALIAATLFFLAHGLFAGQAININEASAEEMAEALTGVGQARAEAIVEFREEHGRFMSADDLALVSGVGEVTVERNRERIRVDD
ncbi:helix-hairpin-helix domain-containing protein [Natronospira bacteriovora]|uniref:Helix-hairpin-helix domain-containing protein n=1 Tax=Natronospira bacteriovora TaxID=3069753 RepID=A0ABU0W5I9_9GAMM|nr:helix-hairpin-helix domain-containing protein [Natronospira sp. AB-CW4]MDQ2069188.1 helix-hairpin-helix domain-containing protein [Natronospira sp. AB-CW4]